MNYYLHFFVNIISEFTSVKNVLFLNIDLFFIHKLIPETLSNSTKPLPNPPLFHVCPKTKKLPQRRREHRVSQRKY